MPDLELYATHLKSLAQTQLYREALRAQMEITWLCTKTYLQNCAAWSSAKTVLDLGCGPGDLIVKLSQMFREKIYAGYDLMPEFVAEAKMLAHKNAINAKFAVLNLTEDAWPKADFIILRCVLQHIRNLDDFLNQMNSAIAKNKFVLFFDAADDQVFCMSVPPISQWEKLMTNLGEKQKLAGGNRNALSLLLRKLPAHWKIVDDKITTPKIEETDRFSFAQYVLSVGNLLPDFFGMDVDRAALTNETIAWLCNPDSSATFKSRWLLLQRE